MDEILPEEKEMSEIPDINKYPELLDSARTGSLVVFVGAGVSAIKGYYLWDQYARNMVNDLYKKQLIDYAGKLSIESMSPRKKLTLCNIIYKENGLNPRENSKDFLGSENENNQPIYDYLYDFNTPFITTNYDKCLDKKIEENNNCILRGKNDACEMDNDFSMNNLSKLRYAYSEDKDFIGNRLNMAGNVFHIHGSFDHMEHMTITLNDYLEKYSANNQLPKFLKYMFSYYTVLFIGYGLEEMEILDTIVNCGYRKESEEATKMHFCLSPILSNQRNLFSYNEKYYANLGVQLIPYYIDKQGYIILEEIIRIWSKTIHGIASEPSLIEQYKTLDKVVK